MAGAMKSKSKLDKMSMPKRPKMDDAMIMELEMEPAEGDEMEPSEDSDMSNELAGESDAEGGDDMEMGPLADVSDDDLIAEMRKRGLSADAEKAASDEPMSDDEY